MSPLAVFPLALRNITDCSLMKIPHRLEEDVVGLDGILVAVIF